MTKQPAKPTQPAQTEAERASPEIIGTQPLTRQQPVYLHRVVCVFCGRNFEVKSHHPRPPRFCRKGDSDGCYTRRHTEQVRALRAKNR